MEVIPIILIAAIVIIAVMAFYDAKSNRATDAESKRENDIFVKHHRKVLSSITADMSLDDRSEMLFHLGKSRDDTYLVFACPHTRLSKSNTVIIETILKEVFKSYPSDKYLYAWFDYWIEDYVKDILIPTLESNAQTYP